MTSKKQRTVPGRRPDLTQPEDELLEERRPDWQNVPQMLRNLADTIQSGQRSVNEIAIAIRDKAGNIVVYGGGDTTINSSTTYFLLHQGAKTLMDLVEESANDGMPH